ncbi:MAG: LPS export ABC transporter ATP-binding protein [Isosphaeraceae bacterium]
MALLEVRGLQKWYGRRQVVNGVDFDVDRGEVVGLLGPNGAGKTTSFRMTIGMIDADGGSVTFDGREVTRLPMYQRARAGMGYLAQDSSVFKLLSVEDNLMAILETRPNLNRQQRRDRQEELLRQFGLTHIRKTKANRVSGGERRRLEIARSLITDPKLIMLDEPFAGIDPKTVGEIQLQIRALAEVHNLGILITDHNVRETLEVTNRSYLIHEGRVVASGDRQQILNNSDARRFYLGDRFDPGHMLDQPPHHRLPAVQPQSTSPEALNSPVPSPLPTPEIPPSTAASHTAPANAKPAARQPAVPSPIITPARRSTIKPPSEPIHKAPIEPAPRPSVPPVRLPAIDLPVTGSDEEEGEFDEPGIMA